MAFSRKGAGCSNTASTHHEKTANADGKNSSSNEGFKENMLLLKSLNPYITCPLCSGYFVDATTIIDCLHTFCKSCLLKYFQDNTDCPKCHYQIHQSHPSHYVAFDRTMQDIVYKLVPGMQAEEQRRRDQFKQRQRVKETTRKRKQNVQQLEQSDGTSSCSSNSSNSITDENEYTGSQLETVPKVMETNVEKGNEVSECCNASQDPTITHRRDDEPVLVRLMPDEKLKPIDRPFVRLSAFATVNTVKRLLAYMLFNDINKYNEFDIFCNNELMGRDFSITFIRKTRWRNKAEPVVLIYKERLDF